MTANTDEVVRASASGSGRPSRRLARNTAVVRSPPPLGLIESRGVRVRQAPSSETATRSRASSGVSSRIALVTSTTDGPTERSRSAASSSSGIVVDAGPGEEVELEVVRGDDVRGGHHPVAHQLRDPRPHEHAAADVTHHRVAAVDRVRRGRLDPGHGVEHHGADVLGALVAREHRLAVREGAALLDPGDHLGDLGRGQDRPAPRAVPGVVGEVHGHHRPDLAAQPLEREDGGAVAGVPVGDVRLDRQDAHAGDLRRPAATASRAPSSSRRPPGRPASRGRWPRRA